MPGNKIEKYLFEGIKILVILILFTPLVLGPFGLSFSEYPKTVYFRTLTEILVILWALLLIFPKTVGNRDIRYPISEIRYPKSEYTPSLTPLTVAVLIFFAVMTVSTLLGFNIMRSFFGSLEVGGGFVTQLHYLAFFLIISGLFREKKDWMLFLRGAVFVSLLSTIAGFLQQFAKIGFYGVSLQSERISGTLSNPVYFGFFTAMAIFLGMYLVASAKDKRERFLWGDISTVNLVALFLSGTRAALLGLLTGGGIIAVLSFFFLVKAGSPWRKRILFGTLAISIFVSGTILFLLQQFPYELPQSLLATKWLSALDPITALEGRYPGWETAVRAWKDRPIFGWGSSSFGYLYDKYFDAHFVKHINAYYVFQNAHNAVLHVMAESGSVGAISYLAIYAVLFVALWRGRMQNQLATFLLIGLFISHFAQNLFAFDTVSTYLLFFLALGLVNNQYCAALKWKVPQLGQFKIAFAIFLILLVFPTFYFLNFKPALAGYDFVRGFFQENKDYGTSIAFYQKGSTRGTFYDRELRVLFASRSLTALEQNYAKDKQKEAMESLVQLKGILKPELQEPEFRYLELYKIIAGIDEWIFVKTRNQAALQEAEEVMKQANAFNDQWFQHYYFLARYAIYEGRYEEGEALFRKGFQLSRGLPEDLISFYRTVGVAYWRAGIVQNKSELREKAAENFRIAAKLMIGQVTSLGPEQKQKIPRSALKADVDFIQQTINLLVQLGKVDEAEKLVEEAREAYGISQ